MADTIHLAIGVYKDTETGQLILDTLKSMNRAGTIELLDLAMLTKSPDGKLQVVETEELTGRKGARRGAVILGLFGLAFPPSFIASVVLGGGIGALAGRIRDTGIKKNQLELVSEQLTPGKVAIVALAKAASQKLVEETLSAFDGQLASQDLGPDTSEDVMALASDLPSATLGVQH